MTVTVALTTIADSISQMSISGVNVRDIDQIPENALSILPVFYPIPNGYITDINFKRQTTGDADALMDLEYVLHYRYLHAAIGSGGGLLAAYSGLLTNLAAILKKILESSSQTGAVDVTLQSVSNIGPLSDPGGQTQYHGVDIALKVLEFAQ